MTVTIASGEQSKTRMKGGTAGVSESPDTGSDWNIEGNYDKQPSVQFRGKQRGGIEAKEYFPTFYGTVEYFGEGGGEEKTYSWSVNATYEVKDIEIHRSVAGGEFVKISDVQNVDPVIAGQKIQLKAVVPPIGSLGNDYTIEWTIGGVAHVKKYTFNSQSASVEQLKENALKVNPITYFYIDGGTTTNEKNTSITVKITKTGMTSINKSASFKVLKPKIDLLNATWTTVNPEVGVRNIGDVPTLMLGDTSSEGISWNAIITPPPGGSGGIAFFQTTTTNQKIIVLTSWSQVVKKITTNEKFVLDNIAPYANLTLAVTENQTSPPLEQGDSPGLPLVGNMILGERTDQFILHLMYVPGNPGSIPITLGTIPWGWQGKATLTGQSNNGVGGWFADPAICGKNGGNANDNITLPIWDSNILDYQWE
jgi:hypothetical protein